MRIVVRRNEDANSSTVIYFLDVTADMTITGLKRMIHQRSTVPPAQQRLTMVRFGCMVLLSESWTCEFYGVHEGCRIHLEILRGVSESKKSHSCQRYYHRLGVISSTHFTLAQKAIRVISMQSCEQGNLEALVLCIRECENVEEMLNQPSARGWTCLHFAAYRGYSELIKQLLTHKISPNVVSTDDWTPLMLACYKGRSECIECLLGYSGIDVNKQTNRGTALHMAALKGRPQVCKRLLETGAQTELLDSKGRIPLEITDCVEIAELIPRFVGERLMAEMGTKCEVEAPFCGELEVLTDDSDSPIKAYFIIDYAVRMLSCFKSRDEFYDKCPALFSLSFNQIIDLSTCEIRFRDSLYYQMSIIWASGSCKCVSPFPEILFEWKSRLAVNIPNYQGPEHTFSMFTEPETPGLDVSATTEKCEENPYLSPNYGVNKEIASEITACGFTIEEEIGHGSFGKVFKVLSRDATHTFAVKCLNKAMLQKHGQLEYAVKENKVMKKLEHPFIVKLYHSFQTPKSLYFLMEYCQNGDLGTHISEKEKFNEMDARFYTAEILLAMEYLHKKNIVYRDMKPENVLLDSQGHIRLADFGLAKTIKGSKAVTSTFCGSPAYLAPEMLTHSGTSRASDIYSLGVLLYEMVVGQPPFFSYNIPEMYKNITSKEVPIPITLSAELRELLKKMLDRNPEARPSARELKKNAFFKGLKWKNVASKKVAPPKLSNFWHQNDVLEVSSPPPKSLWDSAKCYARTPSLEECVTDFD